MVSVVGRVMNSFGIMIKFMVGIRVYVKLFIRLRLQNHKNHGIIFGRISKSFPLVDIVMLFL